jgi:hypothetical protein
MVHLVGFTAEICHDARPYKRQTYYLVRLSPDDCLCRSKQLEIY